MPACTRECIRVPACTLNTAVTPCLSRCISSIGAPATYLAPEIAGDVGQHQALHAAAAHQARAQIPLARTQLQHAGRLCGPRLSRGRRLSAKRGRGKGGLRVALL